MDFKGAIGLRHDFVLRLIREDDEHLNSRAFSRCTNDIGLDLRCFRTWEDLRARPKKDLSEEYP
jgi:hypothetical protein